MQDRYVILESENAELALDYEGRIAFIKDLSVDSAYFADDGGFLLLSDGKKYFERGDCEKVDIFDDRVIFTFIDGDFRAVVTYSAPYDIPFFEKQIVFEKTDGGEFFVDSVVCQKLDFPRAKETLLHDDNSLWHVPLNYFVRYGKGGVIAGLEYPYWDGIDEFGADAGLQKANEVSLGYSPKIPATKFETEKTFIGIYKNEGESRRSVGPYPTKLNAYWPDMPFGGLGQHFAEAIPEESVIPEEVLDFGEIHAMQDFIARHLPRQPLPEDGYFIWQNGWWAGLTTPDVAALAPLADSDVHDLMTFKMYFGHATHPSTEPPYVREARIAPLGFPVLDKEETETVKVGGWHENAVGGDDSELVTGYTEDFIPPADYRALMDEGEKKGVHIASFSTPNNSYVAKPEWLHRRADGEVGTYFGTKLSCPACKEYMDFHFNALTKAIDSGAKRYWAFDGRWLSYKEIAGYGIGRIEPDPCFAEGHGHLPGEGRYLEWKNIEEFKKKLRERYPNTCFEQYYGLKRGGTWSMTYLNADENYYEMGNEENNRLQTYCNENDRFRPTYLNYSSLFGTTPSELEYSIISALSCSAYCQIAGGFAVLRDYPESRETLKGWKKWASENHRYLLSRRTLYGFPGEDELDGSAHIQDGAGYIFLFSRPDADVEKKLPAGIIPEGSRLSLVRAVNKNGEDAFCEITEGDEPGVRISKLTAAIIKVN